MSSGFLVKTMLALAVGFYFTQDFGIDFLSVFVVFGGTAGLLVLARIADGQHAERKPSKYSEESNPSPEPKLTKRVVHGTAAEVGFAVEQTPRRRPAAERAKR